MAANPRDVDTEHLLYSHRKRGIAKQLGKYFDEAIVLHFSTRNTEADSKGYMVPGPL